MSLTMTSSRTLPGAEPRVGTQSTSESGGKRRRFRAVSSTVTFW
jgi:hypothetical protein